jgi:hypothetical protein
MRSDLTLTTKRTPADQQHPDLAVAGLRQRAPNSRAGIGASHVTAHAAVAGVHPGAVFADLQAGAGGSVGGAGCSVAADDSAAPHAFSTRDSAARAIMEEARRDMDLDLCWGRHFERRLFGLGTRRASGNSRR